MKKKLRKSSSNVVVSGVLGGIGEYLGIDPTIIRIIYLLIIFPLVGSPIILYFVLALIIPSGDGRSTYGNSYPNNRGSYNRTRNNHDRPRRKEAEKVRDDDDWSDF